MDALSFEPNQTTTFLLISLRMGGMIFFNPIFGRKSIPAMVKVGLSLGLALAAFPSVLQVDLTTYRTLPLLLCMVKEVFAGYLIGAIVSLFMSIFHIGGNVMDLQTGLGMATLYDPASNSQISLIGNIVTILYSMLFFITNSHVRLLGIAAQSFYIVPLGHRLMQPAAAIYIVEMFSHILAYAIQLALPIIVTQIVVEVAVGILMRMVPQINVFVINLQVKLGVGILVILTIMPAMVKYLEKLNELMLDRVHAGLLVFL